MEFDLSPKFPQKFYESDGGSYSIWSGSDLPLLTEAKVGAGNLALEPRGLALPHYADSSKIGFVLRGSGIVGILSPNSRKEKVVKLNEGDAIPLASGFTSWWYNDGDSTFSVVFLGEANKAHRPGIFSYFFLAGANSIFRGFSTETLSRAWNLDEDQVNKVIKSQSRQIVVKVKEGTDMPRPREEDKEGTVFKLRPAENNAQLGKGGIAALTRQSASLLEKMGLSAYFVKQDPTSPRFFVDSDVQVTYVVNGSGRVEMVDMDGHRVLDAKVNAGQVFVVPRYFTFAIVAETEGMECFTLVINQEPQFSHSFDLTSVLENLSPQLLEAAFNVTPELIKALHR